MTVQDEIRKEVADIAKTYDLKDDRAFAYWYLEEFEELSHEDALETVVDGPWDGGRDAVYEDDGASALRIYQFKYSDDKEYVLKGFSDLQRGLQAEEARVGRFSEVRLILVTILAADPDFVDVQKRVQRLARSWLTRKGFKDCEAIVEVVDLNRFAQLLDVIYGVRVDLTYQGTPTDLGDSVVGIVNARPLAPFADVGALFGFNIRNFLGVRTRSVNSEIKASLGLDSDRPVFWKLNNGIVCLCTDYRKLEDGGYSFENLTVVNGAQTTSTMARYLEENPADDADPVWVVAKILKVNPDAVDLAIRLTSTSNRQTPASSKDLRAVDPLHRTLKEWFGKHYGLTYVYRRGDRGRRGEPNLQMKDLAQSYIAYWSELPHVAFSRAGTIFTSEDLYSQVFPKYDIKHLDSVGTESEIRSFLSERAIPYRILLGVRAKIAEKVRDGRADKKWRSLTYHCVWAYRRMFDAEHVIVDEALLGKIDKIVDASSSDVFNGLTDFLNMKGSEIPRALKSPGAKDDFLSGRFLENSRVLDARAAIKKF